MKLFKKLVWLTPVALIMACSSMAPDNTMEGILPDDFVLSEYAEINPDIAFFQVESKIKTSNSELTTSNTITKEDSIADATAFLADSVVLKEIYQFLKYDVQTAWTSYAEMIAMEIPKYVYLDSFSKTSKVNFIQQVLLPFNSLGSVPSEDLTIIQSNYTQIDSSLIELHYSFYGEIEGRPYRYCKAGEAVVLKDRNDPAQATLNAKNAADFRPNKYCKEAASGAVYLIK